MMSMSILYRMGMKNRLDPCMQMAEGISPSAKLIVDDVHVVHLPWDRIWKGYYPDVRVTSLEMEFPIDMLRDDD